MANSIVTVLMPIFNAMPYLPMALDCILKQTERNIKIYALNDGSSDGSLAYLETIADPRLKIISRGRNGLIKTLNIGLEMTDTPYIARMDADDLCDNNRLEMQLEYLFDNPECVCVGTSSWHLSMDGERIGWPVYMPKDHKSIVDALSKRRSAIIHPTLMARTSIIKNIGGYREDTFPAEDYDLFFRLSNQGQLANLHALVYKIRLHDTSITSSGIQKNQKKYDIIRQQYVHQKSAPNGNGMSKLFLSNDAYSVYLYRKGITKHLNGSKVKAYIYLFASVIISPSRFILYLKRNIIKQSF